MKIAVDAMGGDHAPDEIVRGALLYRAEGGGAELILVGREDDLRRAGALGEGITIRDAHDVVGMDEHPAKALGGRADTSIGVATALVTRAEDDTDGSAGTKRATEAPAPNRTAHARANDSSGQRGRLADMER